MKQTRSLPKLSLAVYPNIPDFTLLKGRSTSIQIRKKMDFVSLCQQKLLTVYVFPYFTRYMKVAFWHKVARNVSGTRGQGMMFCSSKNQD